MLLVSVGSKRRGGARCLSVWSAGCGELAVRACGERLRLRERRGCLVGGGAGGLVVVLISFCDSVGGPGAGVGSFVRSFVRCEGVNELSVGSLALSGRRKIWWVDEEVW